MDRKKFIKTSGLGLGLSFLPGLIHSNTIPLNPENKLNTEPKIVKNSDGTIFNVLGDIQTHKLNGSHTDNQIVEWISNVEPGVGIPPIFIQKRTKFSG